MLLFTFVGVAGWVWVLLATTTAVSIVVLVSRHLGFQKWLLHHVGNYIANQINCEISMETADVQGWIDGSVVLSNVKIRRLRSSDVPNPSNPSIPLDSKNNDENLNSSSSHQNHYNTNDNHNDNHNNHHHIMNNNNDPQRAGIELFCKEVSLRLSLSAFFEGRGILRTLSAKQVRGYIDFRSPSDQKSRQSPSPASPPTARMSARMKNWRESAFDLDALRIDDLQITVHAPDYDPPLQLSIFRASLDRLRQQWLLFDLLTAKYMDGAIDQSLFSCRRLTRVTPPSDLRFGLPKEADQFATHAFHIDKMPLQLLAAKFPASSPFSSMLGGTADVRFQVQFPILHKFLAHEPEGSILVGQDVTISGNVVMSNIAAELPYSFPKLPSFQRHRFASIVNYLRNHSERLPLTFNVQTKLSSFAAARAFSDAGIYTLLETAAVDQITRRIAEKSIDADSRPSFTSLYFGWGEFILRLLYGVVAG